MTRQDLHYFWDIPKDELQLLEEMERGRINRLFDVVFKFIFCGDGGAPLFLDMANAFVFPDGEDRFRQVRFIDRELSPKRVGGKGCRLDAFAVMDDDGKINLEVQFASAKDFSRRVLYYWSCVHSEQLSRGCGYSRMTRTVSVNLLGYEQFRDKRNFRSSFSVRDDESYAKLNDDLLMVFLEIPKFARMAGVPRTKQERWLAYFAGLGGIEMEKIAEREPMIAEALDREKLFLMDMDRRYAYILGWKYRMEESIREAQLKEAEEKCRESDEKLEKTMKELGKREEELEEKRRELEKKRRESEEILRMAEREKTLEIAAKFLENGVPAEIISKSSGLSSEEVQDLASRL